MIGNSSKMSWSMVAAKPGVLVFPMIVGLIIAALGLFAVRPMIGSILDRREQIREEQARLDKLIEKREILESLSVEEMTEELVALNRVLPSRKPIIGVIGAMMGVAAESGVILDAYAFNPGYLASESADQVQPEVPGQLNVMDINLSVGGLYDQVVDYFRKIQTSAPLVKYLTAKLSGGIGAVENPPFSSTLAIQSYYAIPPLTKGKVTDPLPLMSPLKAEIVAKAREYPDYAITATEVGPDFEFQKTNPFTY